MRVTARRRAARGVAMWLLMITGCSAGARDDGGVPRCIPGQSAACACASGAGGAQTCGADGTFGACMCSALPVGDGGPSTAPDSGIATDGSLADGTVDAPADATIDGAAPPDAIAPGTDAAVDAIVLADSSTADAVAASVCITSPALVLDAPAATHSIGDSPVPANLSCGGTMGTVRDAFALDVPAHTGVEITASSTDVTIALHVAGGCHGGPAADFCRIGTSVTTTARMVLDPGDYVLEVNLQGPDPWTGGGPLTSGSYSLAARTFTALPTQSCATAPAVDPTHPLQHAALADATLVGSDGTYPRLFYSVIVPARTTATLTSMRESGIFYAGIDAVAECNGALQADAGRYRELNVLAFNNFSDQERRYVFAVRAGAAGSQDVLFGVVAQFSTLAPNARCSTATVLHDGTLAGESLSGAALFTDGSSSGYQPLFYRATVAAGHSLLIALDNPTMVSGLAESENCTVLVDAVNFSTGPTAWLTNLTSAPHDVFIAAIGSAPGSFGLRTATFAITGSGSCSAPLDLPVASPFTTPDFTSFGGNAALATTALPDFAKSSCVYYRTSVQAGQTLAVIPPLSSATVALAPVSAALGCGGSPSLTARSSLGALSLRNATTSAQPAVVGICGRPLTSPATAQFTASITAN